MPVAHPGLPFPSSASFLLRILTYAAGLLFTGLGGYHGYRYTRGAPFERESTEAARLRDELVFGDEDARELGVPPDPNPFKLDDDPDKDNPNKTDPVKIDQQS